MKALIITIAVILISLLGIFPAILSSQISKDEDMQRFQKDAAKGGHRHGRS